MNTGQARLSRSYLVPVTEIRLARKYREDFLSRFDDVFEGMPRPRSDDRIGTIRRQTAGRLNPGAGEVGLSCRYIHLNGVPA